LISHSLKGLCFAVIEHLAAITYLLSRRNPAVTSSDQGQGAAVQGADTQDLFVLCSNVQYVLCKCNTTLQYKIIHFYFAKNLLLKAAPETSQTPPGGSFRPHPQTTLL
jgi:hypothetical protein